LLNFDFLFKSFVASEALVDRGVTYSYSDLLKLVQSKQQQLRVDFKGPVPVVLSGDFTLLGIAWLLALLAENYVVLIQTPQAETDMALWQRAGIQAKICAEEDTITWLHAKQPSGAIAQLLDAGDGGILLLSSGTSGQPKLIVHAAARLMSKYTQSKKPYRTLGFLLFDHIAGFDTLMYTLHAGGTLVTLPNRFTRTVLEALREHKVAVLPTSPSFINLLLFEPQFNPTDLPYLKIVTFGSERMNTFTLNRLIERFGDAVRCEQKYGLTELGSLVLKSKPKDPAWIQLDNRFATWKVIDNQLFIKTNTSLLAYIYPDREEACEGWFNTEDQVLVDGDWLQILGRKSDLINVGGQKVYPAEVEAVIQSMPNVLQVVVHGMAHPLMGQVVAATIQLVDMEEDAEFRSRLRVFCKNKLSSFKIPVNVTLSTSSLMSDRFKAQRKV
jgi:acyl-CoA synthetase (AMP-forming)/AMP-acid ligase II